ncbi:MAG: ribose 5-phosphate isomerase B [Clostridiaceae bacterium]|nr:ribose 5-phosphate isomerase B [Clostridiaceae bacterium]
MKIGIGSDHAGHNLRREIIKHIENRYQVIDYGTCSLESVDYPDYGFTVAQAVVDGECDRGIVICGTGIGISISANKVPGIRAALCTDSFMARMSREHNDANILALGERIIGVDLALDIVDVWLKSEFLGGRHKMRVDKISEIEKRRMG